MSLINQNELHSLLQNIYFDNIDSVNAKGASKAMHENVEWIHTQVWEHDGHKSSTKDVLEGRDEVREFLRKRVIEMQVEGIIHRVENVVSDGKLGAFKANVIGTDKSKKPFFGLVELKDDKIIYYRVLPQE